MFDQEAVLMSRSMFRATPPTFALFVAAACLALAAAPSASAQANLVLANCQHSDTCARGGPGDADGNVDPGESVSLILFVQNTGGADATNVSTTVTTLTGGVTVTQPTSSFGTVAAFSGGIGAPPAAYTVDASVPCGTSLVFDVLIESDQGDFTDVCRVSVPSPCIACAATPASLSVASCATNDDCAFGGPGDANGDIEPGETGSTIVMASNSGGTDATNVTGVVSTLTAGVTITQANVSFGTIPAFSLGLGTPAATFTVDPTMPCGTNIVLDVRFQSDQGNFTDSCTRTVPAPCRICAATPPSLSVASCNHSSACAFGGPGDGNGFVDPGEDGSMVIVLANDGGSDATGVTARVSSGTAGVTIVQPNVAFGTVPAFGAAPGFPGVDYTVDVSVACGTDLVFIVDVSSDQGASTDSCMITIPAFCAPCTNAPVLLTVQGCSASDECAVGGPGDADGAVDPGEIARVVLIARNSGNVDATNVTATVSTTTPGVTVVQGATNIGTVPASGVGFGVPEIELSLAGSVPCGTDIVLDVAFSSDQGAFSSSCVVPVPSPCTPCISTPPALSLASCVPTDRCGLGGPGDGNGAVEPGESASVVLTVANAGSTDATNVTATVSTSSPGVILVGGPISFGTVPGFGMAAGATTLGLTVDISFPCGTDIVLDVVLGSDQGSFNGSCRLAVPTACELCAPGTGYGLAHVSSTLVQDRCPAGGAGSFNFQIDPGETVRVSTRVLNEGPGNATAVTGTLVSLTPGATVTVALADYGDIASGAPADAALPYEFTTDPLVIGCGDALAFRIDFNTGEGRPSPDAVNDLAVASPCTPCVGSSPPGEVPWLITRCTSSGGLEVEWLPAIGADVYDLHQGTIAGLGTPGMPWDHACVAKDLVPPLRTLAPGTTCGDDLDLYFLVIGRNPVGIGPFGLSDVAGGSQRDPGAPCP